MRHSKTGDDFKDRLHLARHGEQPEQEEQMIVSPPNVHHAHRHKVRERTFARGISGVALAAEVEQSRIGTGA